MVPSDSFRITAHDVSPPDEEGPMAATRTPSMIEQQRAEAFLALGFSTTQAFVLAATRVDGHHIEAREVQRMLSAGCDHDLALRILL
jgi:hypothetical protein